MSESENRRKAVYPMAVSVTLSWSFNWDGVSHEFDRALTALKFALLDNDIDFYEVTFEDGQYAGSQANEAFAEAERYGDIERPKAVSHE